MLGSDPLENGFSHVWQKSFHGKKWDLYEKDNGRNWLEIKVIGRDPKTKRKVFNFGLSKSLRRVTYNSDTMFIYSRRYDLKEAITETYGLSEFAFLRPRVPTNAKT